MPPLMPNQFSPSENQTPHHRPPHLPLRWKTAIVRTDRGLLRIGKIIYASANNKVTDSCLTSTFASCIRLHIQWPKHGSSSLSAHEVILEWLAAYLQPVCTAGNMGDTSKISLGAEGKRKYLHIINYYFLHTHTLPWKCLR